VPKDKNIYFWPWLQLKSKSDFEKFGYSTLWTMQMARTVCWLLEKVCYLNAVIVVSW